MKEIIPIIHATSVGHGLESIEKCILAGAKKFALIDQYIERKELVDLIIEAEKFLDDFDIMVNMLGRDFTTDYILRMVHWNTDNLWFDWINYKESGTSLCGFPFTCIYGGYNFKYKKKYEFTIEDVKRFRKTLDCKFILTLSGKSTGSPIDLEELRSYETHFQPHEVALASGVSVDNINIYKEYADTFFVGASIEDKDKNIEVNKLKELLQAVK